MTQRTWIYSLPEAVTDAQRSALTQAFSHFLAEWKTHGAPVQGTIDLRHDRFVIVQSAPDAQPSGCSIDSMKQAVTRALLDQQLTWLDNAQVVYRTAEGDIAYTHFQEIPVQVAEGALNAETIVFDNTLNQTDDLNLWEQPLNQTWLRRYLPKIQA